ncbi:MAG: hypothetical protein LBD41_04905 [Clostridiales Family XIII bacterium]|jgi:hypothetical protein|nr:hypothetical protein [Clostridiales Family XIII bacterium]
MNQDEALRDENFFSFLLEEFYSSKAFDNALETFIEENWEDSYKRYEEE